MLVTMLRPLPTLRQLLLVAHHAVDNSVKLLDDASLLLQHERWSRAHALAVLALEELGKAGLCVAALSYDEGQAEDFWTDFKHHATKLVFAGALLTFLGEEHATAITEALEQLQVEAKDEHARKLHGLYVGLSTSGALEHPDDVNEVAARRVVDHVRTLHELLGPAWTSGALLERLEEIEAHSDELQAVFGQARQLVQLDPNAAVAIGRAGMLGELPGIDSKP